jgi:hypothetical protein
VLNALDDCDVHDGHVDRDHCDVRDGTADCDAFGVRDGCDGPCCFRGPWFLSCPRGLNNLNVRGVHDGFDECGVN